MKQKPKREFDADLERRLGLARQEPVIDARTRRKHLQQARKLAAAFVKAHEANLDRLRREREANR